MFKHLRGPDIGGRLTKTVSKGTALKKDIENTTPKFISYGKQIEKGHTALLWVKGEELDWR